MKFSIIIPSYGQVKYLRDAIESALSQTIDPNSYEVIVVDDGSTDGSLEIAKEYEPRIFVIEQTNKGLASARNAGIMNANGNFIVPLDADDKLMPDALWEIDNYLDENPDTAVVGLSLRCRNEDTGETQDTILLENPAFPDFKDGNRLAYCAAIRKSTLLSVGGYSPKMDTLGGWEDLHMWYTLLNRGYTLHTIQKPLLLYRVKKQSMSKEAEKNKVALWAQIVKDFPEVQVHVKS